LHTQTYIRLVDKANNLYRSSQIGDSIHDLILKHKLQKLTFSISQMHKHFTEQIKGFRDL